MAQEALKRHIGDRWRPSPFEKISSQAQRSAECRVQTAHCSTPRTHKINAKLRCPTNACILGRWIHVMETTTNDDLGHFQLVSK